MTYELSYFWGLCGTAEALVTPDVNFDFPDGQFIVFFLGHALIIASVLFLTFGMRMRPHARSILRVMAWSLVYLRGGRADRLAARHELRICAPSRIRKR